MASCMVLLIGTLPAYYRKVFVIALAFGGGDALAGVDGASLPYGDWRFPRMKTQSWGLPLSRPTAIQTRAWKMHPAWSLRKPTKTKTSFDGISPSLTTLTPFPLRTIPTTEIPTTEIPEQPTSTTKNQIVEPMEKMFGPHNTIIRRHGTSLPPGPPTLTFHPTLPFESPFRVGALPMPTPTPITHTLQPPPSNLTPALGADITSEIELHPGVEQGHTYQPPPPPPQVFRSGVMQEPDIVRKPPEIPSATTKPPEIPATTTTPDLELIATLQGEVGTLSHDNDELQRAVLDLNEQVTQAEHEHNDVSANIMGKKQQFDQASRMLNQIKQESLHAATLFDRQKQLHKQMIDDNLTQLEETKKETIIKIALAKQLQSARDEFIEKKEQHEQIERNLSAELQKVNRSLADQRLKVKEFRSIQQALENATKVLNTRKSTNIEELRIQLQETLAETSESPKLENELAELRVEINETMDAKNNQGQRRRDVLHQWRELGKEKDELETFMSNNVLSDVKKLLDGRKNELKKIQMIWSDHSMPLIKKNHDLQMKIGELKVEKEQIWNNISDIKKRLESVWTNATKGVWK